MVIFALVVAFIVVPILELAAIIWVGTQIGILPTIALLIVDSIVGAMLMRHQGRAAWRRFNEALQERRAPTREVVDGGLVIFGGALLLTPGFITDILGFTLLLPPTRRVVRAMLMSFFGKRFIVARVATGAAGMGARAYRGRTGAGAGAGAGARRNGASQPYDVEGTAVDVDAGDPPPLTP
jgi:UPF0716 protein FxsA